MPIHCRVLSNRWAFIGLSAMSAVENENTAGIVCPTGIHEMKTGCKGRKTVKEIGFAAFFCLKISK